MAKERSVEAPAATGEAGSPRSSKERLQGKQRRGLNGVGGEKEADVIVVEAGISSPVLRTAHRRARSLRRAPPQRHSIHRKTEAWRPQRRICRAKERQARMEAADGVGGVIVAVGVDVSRMEVRVPRLQLRRACRMSRLSRWKVRLPLNL
jgi:hypothetical protein